MADDSPNPPSDTSGSEPSMEEILASIRKIIADDDPAKNNAEVLELTQMVQDDGSVVDLKADAAPPPPAMVAEPPKMEAPKKAAAPPPPPPPPSPAPTPPPPKMAAPPPPPAPVVPPPDSLVSEPAASATASALSSLASTVEIERLSSVPPLTTTFIGNGARTLEEMAMQLMKPLLKEWLDQNLPPIVDRLVHKEIERITRKDRG